LIVPCKGERWSLPLANSNTICIANELTSIHFLRRKWGP
jgi:hypothetical protein